MMTHRPVAGVRDPAGDGPPTACLPADNPSGAQWPPATSDGLYVYCVGRGNRSPSFGPIGLDSRWVYALADGDICAVVHNCPPEPYQSDVRETVEDWVLAHQRVIEAATEALGTVLPMAFNMIVRPDPDRTVVQSVEAWLAEKRESFTRLLDKLAGKAEYGVQIFWDRQLVAEDLVRTNPELRETRHRSQNQPRGMAYMLQQKLAKATRAALERQANRYVEDFYGRVRRCVEDVRVDKLTKTDAGKQMLLNLSCLMEEGSGALGTVLDEIQKTQSVSVRFTGPWPPYSFVGG